MARARNVFVVDDVHGNLNFVRGGSGTPLGSADPLVQGKNLLSGRAVIEYNQLIPEVSGKGQNFGNDTHNMAASQDVSSTVLSPIPLTGLAALRQYVVPMEMAGDTTDAKMHAEHELAAMLMTSFEAVITVQGWLMSNGNLGFRSLAERLVR